MGHFDPAVECAADRPGGGDTHRHVAPHVYCSLDGHRLCPGRELAPGVTGWRRQEPRA
jgi:hypothetical protein